MLQAPRHRPGEVARVPEAANRQAVQVDGLHKVRQEGSLQAQNVPPVGGWGCMLG